jgi:hypothetical protein
MSDTKTTDKPFRLSEWFDLSTGSRREIARNLGVSSPGDPVGDNEQGKVWLMRITVAGKGQELAREVRRYAPETPTA